MTERKVALSLGEVARRLDEAGISWAVFAGAAAGAYGATRPVTDVDLLVPAAKGEQVAALFPEAQVEALEEGCLGILLPGVDILAGPSHPSIGAKAADSPAARADLGSSVCDSPGVVRGKESRSWEELMILG